MKHDPSERYLSHPGEVIPLAAHCRFLSATQMVDLVIVHSKRNLEGTADCRGLSPMFVLIKTLRQLMCIVLLYHQEVMLFPVLQVFLQCHVPMCI